MEIANVTETMKIKLYGKLGSHTSMVYSGYRNRRVKVPSMQVLTVQKVLFYQKIHQYSTVSTVFLSLFNFLKVFFDLFS